MAVKTARIWNPVGNGVWQLMPSAATLVLSFFIVRFFSASIWGSIVAVLIVQQIINGILTWGNKDYLQREIASNQADFKSVFSGLFRERFVLFFLITTLVLLTGWIDRNYLTAFVLLVFGRFLYQSFDILIVKERKFLLVISLEIITLAGQIITLILLSKKGNVDINLLLLLFWSALLIKSFVLFAIFRKYFVWHKNKEIQLFKSFSFAMLNISGLLHSRIDILLISRLLTPEILGKYQIITAFLWNIQSISLYISGPYIHNFYRLNQASQQNYSRLLKRLGIFIVPISVAVMVPVLQYAFGIKLEASMIAASVLFGIMTFIYLPWIFSINQQKKEYFVLLINVCGIGVLAILLISVYKISGLSLETTIWIVTIHQVLIALAAFFVYKKTITCYQS